MSHVHIIGGGLAGLSAAIELSTQAQVTLYEAGPVCGGRARSYYDRSLDALIDNGNHLILSANALTFRYLDIIGSRDTLVGPGEPIFPYYDLAKDLAWTLRLSNGRIPFWALSRKKKVPGMRLSEFASIFRLLRAKDETTVEECLSEGQLSRRLLEPLSISALNTDLKTGSALLLANVMRRSLMQGGMACRPWFPETGLSETFVDPALAFLSKYHGIVKTGSRVNSIQKEGGRVQSFETTQGIINLGAEDYVIVATPAPVTQNLLPEVSAPDAYESIVNVHYKLPFVPHIQGVVARSKFIGLVGGIAEWVFIKGNILSVTVSAANRYAAQDNETLTSIIWSEIRRATNPVITEELPDEAPPSRLVREKRATFAATPEQNRKRPYARTDIKNMALAGDWTNTGLPSTIEGAIQSGLSAVSALGFRSAVFYTEKNL
ncbi:hydroxysqualene dehydroxylase HpnE [Swingsia samuiensis]|uniref:FAD-dependent oxidoreductase n=1 Tax=Swingsia samuiensis TaxID=1293412 RepID=A0A4Y6UP25_9PROT|nr:hydroxysqualene dehydroxylase HpnE [Swingsia samuiensis]QDH17805.1 FAD-dependent oxidoreductase [Swingsia samuiensis]